MPRARVAATVLAMLLPLLCASAGTGAYEEKWSAVLSSFRAGAGGVAGSSIVLVSPAYRFAILIPRGKTGSTTVFQTVVSFMCHTYAPTKLKPNARDWDSAWRLGWKRRVDRITGRVHQGTKSVQGCIRYLKDHRLLQYGGSNVDVPRAELESYRIIIVMRDPEARYVSALQDVFKPRQSPADGKFAPRSDPSDLHMLSDLDVTCSHCKEQTANSNHWAPQYTSILDSNLPHVDEIICTESLDDDLGHVAHMVNVRSDAVRKEAWLGAAVDGAKRRKRFAIRPLNFTRNDKGHLRHSTRRMSKDKVFSDRNLDFTDGTGYTFKVDPRMLRLFEGDMRLNPCIRRMRQARAPAG